MSLVIVGNDVPDAICDEPKCKGPRTAYEAAKDSAARAAAAVEAAKDGRNTAIAGAGVTGTGSGIGATILSVGTATTTAGVTTTASTGWTGWGLVIGLGIIALGATAVAVAKHIEVVDLRKECHRKNMTWRDAKEKVMSDCPQRCWPDFPLINCA